MKRTLVILLLVVFSVGLLASEAAAAVSDAAVLFLRIAPNARSAGMGEAFVAIADDASTTHWNPAGLGEYPLAHAWYQFKLTDDSHLKELAEKALEKKLPASLAEKFASWQINGNEISRYAEGEWITSEKIVIDSSRTILANLSRRAPTTDKEKLKLALRAICLTNTGISFDEINTLRTTMLAAAAKDKEIAGRVNSLIEGMVVFWQDLRINPDAFAALKEKVATATADNALIAEELGEIEPMVAACETVTRPGEIRVPYPVLLTVWQGWEVPWEQNIDKIAVMENSVPNDNYSHYDIWALTNFGLARFDGVSWHDGDNVEPRKGDKLKDIVSRALGTADDSIIGSRLEMVALANNTVSRERLKEIKTQLEAVLPAEFEGRDEFVKDLNRLDSAWLGCLLVREKVTVFIVTATKVLSDSAIAPAETDKLVFALEKSFSDELPEQIRFPFKAAVSGKINDLAVDRKTLYVATESGLFRYNGRSWEKYSTAADTGAVWCVEPVKRGQLWIGTDSGVKVLREGKWTNYGPEQGITAAPIRNIFVKNDKVAWAASDHDLFFFDGTSWSNQHKYTTTVTDSALSVFTKFYSAIDLDRMKVEVAKLQIRNAEFYANPKAGEVISIPYAPLFDGQITALAMGGDNDLWVGTELGVKRFDGKTWHNYGYRAVRIDTSITVEELARRVLKTGDPDKIAGFVNIIKKKNTLQDGPLPVGRVVYVYSNPAGSPINALCEHGGRMYVASLYGTFSYENGRWERYYHEGLNQTQTKDIVSEMGEMWFATSDRVIIFAQGKRELSFTHANWLPELASDLYYEFLGYVQPLGSLGTVGANITFLSYGTITTTGETSSQPTGEISPFDVALTGSYGTRASRNLAIGLSAKIIYSRLSVVGAGREIGKGSGTSFAAEAGILYAFTKKLRLGAVLTNLGPNMSYIDAAQSDALPRNLAVGFSYRLIDSPYNRLTLVGEINKLLTSLDESMSQEFREAIENVGLEYWYGSLLALRAGYIYDREGQIKTSTLGVGLQYRGKYRLDFAYIPSSENLPLANTLRTSLTVRL